MSTNHSTPLSMLADLLKIKRNNLPTEKLTDVVCATARIRIKATTHKLGGTTRFVTAMAQELQEIIGEAEAAGCKNPFPATQGLLKEWEVFYQVMNLIGEVAE